MRSTLTAITICFLTLLALLTFPLSCRADEASDAALNALIQEATTSDGASAESCAVKLGASFLSDPRAFIRVLSTWNGEIQEDIVSMVVYDQNGPYDPDFQLTVARLEGDPSLTDPEYATVMLMQALCAPEPENNSPEMIEATPVSSTASSAQPPQPDKRPLYWGLGLALFGVFFAIFAFKGIRKL